MAKQATTKAILKRIEESWSVAKHEAQPQALPHEIQFQLGCSWGRALSHANEIITRLRHSERLQDALDYIRSNANARQPA
jgi:hypothetical protein